MLFRTGSGFILLLCIPFLWHMLSCYALPLLQSLLIAAVKVFAVSVILGSLGGINVRQTVFSAWRRFFELAFKGLRLLAKRLFAD